jgi:DNA-binding LacI/PurR family transcriptional regulator
LRRRDRRFQALLDELRRQIGNSFWPGESLPSNRALASMHGVGETTVQRAMMVLVSEGCVKVVPNVGSYKANAGKRAAKSKSLAVGLMTRRSADVWPKHEIYAALQAEALRRKIKFVAVPHPHASRYTPGRSQIQLAQVPWNTFDVGLLVEAEDTIRLRDPLLLARKVIAVDHDATEYGIDSVAFANSNAGKIAAQHLLGLGHTRFAVTEEQNDPGFPADPAWTERQFGFEAAIKSAGGSLLPQWRLQIPRRGYQQSPDRFIKAAAAAWAAAPVAQRPTALFVLTSDPLDFNMLISQLARHGLRIPTDLSLIVLTTNGKVWGGGEPERDGIRLTSIDFDLSALVRRTFDAAKELAEEKRPTAKRPSRPPKLFLAPAMLAPGTSTAPPRK